MLRDFFLHITTKLNNLRKYLKMNKVNNIVLSSLNNSRNFVETTSVLPPGYIEVRLSTKGKLGAPEVFHVRNFKVNEIIALSMSSEVEIPIRLISILNDAIFEDVNVATWHEKEVEELMVYIFISFYKKTLDDIPFPLNEDDLEIIRQRENGEETLQAIKDGKYVPRVNINIANDVDTYDLSDDFSPNVTITNKKTGFFVTFGFIKYGDQLIIKNWLDTYFSNEEKQFSLLKKKIEFNQGIANQIKDNPEVIEKLYDIDPEEERAYKDFLMRRMEALSEMVHIISIVNYNGQDVSDLTADEKYNLMSQDARIDYNLLSKLTKRLDKVHYGIKPDVSMRNPITNEVVKRPLSFRIPTLIQAMQLSGSDDYDDGFDDET